MGASSSHLGIDLRQPFRTEIDSVTHAETSTAVRLIARLDVKGPHLIKGVHLEGLRKVGSPVDFARAYYEAGIDEILFMDVVASLYGRNQFLDVLQETAKEVFVPITVGGGVRSQEDFEVLLRNGADKIAINTAAHQNPKLISDFSRRFGSQAVVVSIEARKVGSGQWEALTDNGRERTGRDVLQWSVEATQLGAGEVLITSVDREGTRSGFDVDLVAAIADRVECPIVASGGMGSVQDFVNLASSVDVGGIAAADALHFKRVSIREIRETAFRSGVGVRLDV